MAEPKVEPTTPTHEPVAISTPAPDKASEIPSPEPENVIPAPTSESTPGSNTPIDVAAEKAPVSTETAPFPDPVSEVPHEPVSTVPETPGITLTPGAPEPASAPAELPGNPADAAKRFGIDNRNYSNSRADQQYALPTDSAPAVTPDAAPIVPPPAPKSGGLGGFLSNLNPFKRK